MVRSTSYVGSKSLTDRTRPLEESVREVARCASVVDLRFCKDLFMLNVFIHRYIVVVYGSPIFILLEEVSTMFPFVSSVRPVL